MLFILGASILSESTLAATYVNQSVTAYVADQGSLTYHGTVKNLNPFDMKRSS